jgi:hypothetical protein
MDHFGKTSKVCYHSKLWEGRYMNKTKRLIFYLVINILVSALTTLAVLWIWDRAHPQPIISVTAPPTQTTSQDAANADGDVPSETPTQSEPTPTPTLEPTLDFAEETDVSIRAIVGAGNLDAEYVDIINQSNGKVDLTGWVLKDESGQEFIFPSLILNSGGAIKIYSKPGQNLSVIELFWNVDAPVWESGEIATLLDASGNAISTYTIP